MSTEARKTITTPEGAGPGTSAEGLFTRQASGLVREIGITGGAAISMATVGVLVPLVFFNSSLISFSKADMYVPMLAAVLIWFVVMFAYRHLVRAIPRAGGEYVYLSRTVSPVVGSLAGLSIAVVFIYIFSVNGQIFATYTPFMLTGLASALHIHALASAANHVSSNGAKAAIGAGVVLASALLSMYSLRRVAQVVLGLVALQVVTLLIVLLLLADHSHSAFAHSFAAYSGHSDAYQALIAAGAKAGVAYGASVGAMVASIPFMMLSYNGVLYSYYLGGELRRPGRTYLYASGISIALLAALWFGLWGLLRHTVGLDFMQAQANLGATNPAAYGHITGLSASAGGLGYAYLLAGDPISKILISIALPLSMLSINIAFFQVCTRILFAQAFDRLLPLSVAKVNDRTHAPTIAAAIVAIGGICFTVLQSYVTLTSIVGLESLFILLIVLAGGVSCAYLPLRRPELVSVGDTRGLRRWAGLPKITWIGLASIALTGFAIVEVVVHQSVYGKFDAQSISALVVVVLAGPVVYTIARAVRKRRQGLDIGMAMHELPPE